jgi:hypothetical protein
MQRHREKGLCFSCNERFTPGHRCAAKQLMILEAEPTDDDEGLGVPATIEAEADTNNDEEPQISLYALAGYTSPRTM